MKRNIGLVVLQVSVALYLLVGGITGLIDSSAGDLAPVVNFLNGLFESRSIVTIMIIVLSITKIIAGFLLLAELFSNDMRITDAILLLVIILWIVNIVLVDFITPVSNGNIFNNVSSVLRYLGTLSSHLMVLGALIMVTGTAKHKA